MPILLIQHLCTWNRHFLAPIVEFQIFKALCKLCDDFQINATNITKTHLYECDLRGNKKIGNIIKYRTYITVHRSVRTHILYEFFFWHFFSRLVMSKGSSTKWQTLFKMIVGHQQIEIEPLLEYFQPLHDHLSVINNDEHIGWNSWQNVWPLPYKKDKTNLCLCFGV